MYQTYAANGLATQRKTPKLFSTNTKAIVNNAKEAEIDIEEPQDFKMYPGKGVTCKNSYGHVYAGNSKFLSENNIDINIDTQLNKLKNEGKKVLLIDMDQQGNLSTYVGANLDTEEVVEKIKASVTNESTLRGTISMGSIQDTVNDFMAAAAPIFAGEEPYPVWNGSTFVLTAETYAE